MKHVSASNAEAWVRCGASHVLPQHDSYQEKTERGTDGHDLVSGFISGRPGAAEKVAKEWPDLGFKLEALLLGTDGRSTEPAYVVDFETRTSIYLGRNIGRQYEQALGRPLKSHEIGTSLDLQAVKGGRHYIRDWKFGRYSSQWQLVIQAMAVLWNPQSTLPTAEGRSEVDAGFVFIEDRDGETSIYEDASTIYLMDLDARADELMAAAARVEAMEKQIEKGLHYSDLKVTEGKWCEYCGAFPHCPAKWKMVRAVLGMDVVQHIAALTHEECGAAWKKFAEIEKNIIKKGKDALKVRMREEGGFPTGDGKLLKLVAMPGRDSLDRAAVLALLREKGVTQDEINGLFKEGGPYEQVREVRR